MTTISLSDHSAYITYHNQINADEGSIAEAILHQENLFNSSTPLEEKRRLLFLLGHAGTWEAYQTLEKYLQNPDTELAAWATLALQECGTWLKSDLLGEDQTGILGTTGNRMRFWFVISTAQGKIVTNKQREIIQNTYLKVSEELDSIIEEIEFGDNYALITVLIPPNVAPAEVMEGGIEKSNDPIPFLRFHYYTVNTSKQTKEEIEEYLKELEEGVNF